MDNRKKLLYILDTIFYGIAFFGGLVCLLGKFIKGIPVDTSKILQITGAIVSLTFCLAGMLIDFILKPREKRIEEEEENK